MEYCVTSLDKNMKVLFQKKIEFNGTPRELAKQVAEEYVEQRKRVDKSLAQYLGEHYPYEYEIKVLKKSATIIGPGGVDHYLLVEEKPSLRWDGCLNIRGK